MRLKARRQRSGPQENLVPLINIVFLILIFFLVASTIRPFTQRDVTLAETVEASAGGTLPRTLVLTRTGERYAGGMALDDDGLARQVAAWAGETGASVTIVADADLDASALVDAVAALTAAGVKDIELLTRRAR